MDVADAFLITVSGSSSNSTGLDIDIRNILHLLALLQNIQGFVSSLRCPPLRDRELFDPLTPFKLFGNANWQANYMISFANRIGIRGKFCESYTALIRRWRNWWKNFSSESGSSLHKDRLALKCVTEGQLVENQAAISRIRLTSIFARRP